MVRGRRPAQRRDAPTVDIRASAPCEFLLFLSECSAVNSQASTALGKGWFDALRVAADPALLVAIDRFSDTAPNGAIQLWTRLIPLAYGTPAPHDVPAFLGYFAALPPLQIRLNLLGYHDLQSDRVAPQEILFMAAQGDEAAIRESAARHFPADATRREALIDLLVAGPEETRARLVALLRRWYEEVFRDREGAILPILERDAQATRLLAQTLAIGELVETITNGVEFMPWPGLRRVVLLPNYVKRPWTEHLYREEFTIFCYPVADEHLVEGDAGPPTRLIRLHQALGDERRLRILRHLATERATFQEIAAALGLPKSSLHYHLGILRSAGLLRVGSGPRGIVYSLRRERLRSIDDSLLRYFDGVAPGEPTPD